MSRVDTSSLVRQELGIAALTVLDAHARALGARLFIRRAVKRQEWIVRVSGPVPTVELRGEGSLSAVIDAALLDWQEQEVAA